jgi:hypothetical protein
VGSSLQPVEVRSPPDMGYMVPQSYAAVGNRSYPGVLDRNQRATIPGVIYPDKYIIRHGDTNIANGCFSKFLNYVLSLECLAIYTSFKASYPGI